MLKELWILIKMLFATRPSDYLGKDLEVQTMKHFPFAGSRYMSWCGKIITRGEKEAVINRFLTTKAGAESKTHEGGHVKQAIDEHGDNWPRYYLNYFWNWIKFCPWMKPGHAAYYCNCYEVQAFANDDKPDYWKGNTRIDLKGKYSIKNAKKLYKQLGGTPQVWKAYIKTL